MYLFIFLFFCSSEVNFQNEIHSKVFGNGDEAMGVSSGADVKGKVSFALVQYIITHTQFAQFHLQNRW